MNDATAPSVFAGLAPERIPAVASGAPKTMHPTMPILLVGTMAVLNLTPGAAQPAAASAHAPSGANVTTASGARVATVRAVSAASTANAPMSYHVAPGDSVSSIASRFGLSATSILALNGLSKTSMIHPGQVLTLKAGGKTAPAATSAPTPRTYTVASGDTIAAIARRFGVPTAAVLAANNLRSQSIIRPGQILRIPGQGLELKAVAASSVKPTPTAQKPAGRDYLVHSGDTVSSIAAAFQISTGALLAANGLSSTSTIYAGSTLLIPGAATTAPKGVTALTSEQAANASTIIGVGRELGVPDYGIVIALAAAMQESSMRNLTYGHLDSVGLFQQRPSSGWGTTAQLTTPSHAARLFFGGPHNPNKGKTRGLLDISGWQSLSVTRAAQKVQVSAYPDAYAKWEASARFWLTQLG